ncbi:uncharacterized protein LOC111919929 [Lactuca sativa]|uniref:uncharacterized protein LOC111919929 n=1 Tax=Lactuca sativa TaxID=4236 RepID=UPI000CD89EC8|nr:uncharacterized protein LOC111919929 [Lactuca sativa]
MGDFNEVRDDSERFGSNFNSSSARAFNDFINSLDLVDIPLGGPRFTWNDKWGSKFSKLDIFLVTEGFMDTFPHLSVIVLEKNIPDHRPILLLEHRVDYGLTPFRLFHSWFDMEGFDNIVRETWATSLVGTELTNHWIIFKKKLQLLKSSLRVWNSKHRDMVVSKRKNLQDLLDSIDTTLMDDEGSANLREQRVSLTKELSDLDHLVQADLAHKAKIQRQTAIRGLMIDGVWEDYPVKVKKGFHDYFQSLFQQHSSWRPAVWDYGSNKAPGPDGFTFGFLKRYWDLVATDVEAFVHHFYHHSVIPKGCNATFFSIIPKVRDLKTPKDFRPISLICCQYKIIGKLLTNRLVEVIHSVVSLEQSAFIKGRQILDGPFLLNELVAWSKSSKNPLLLFKVDYEKAFDSLSWDYLLEIMSIMGFRSM